MPGAGVKGTPKWPPLLGEVPAACQGQPRCFRCLLVCGEQSDSCQEGQTGCDPRAVGAGRGALPDTAPGDQAGGCEIPVVFLVCFGF